MSLIDHHTAYDLAVGMLRRAGFELSHQAQQTESAYYVHPARQPLLLRVSMHKTKKSPIGMAGVVARLTFTARDVHLSPTLVTNRVKWAIGEYFLGEPKPSRYRGKRGTWEHEADDLSIAATLRTA